MPSCSASRVVRSARICFRRSEARWTGAAAAAAIESATQGPSTARPGREGRTRTRFPSTTKRALTARARQGASIGSTALATRCGWKEMRKRSPSGRKRSSFASRSGASEPTSSPLNASVTGSSTSVIASATAASAAAVVSSGSTWVRAGVSVRTPVKDAFASDAASRRASTASPGREGMMRKSLRATTCARRGFGRAAETRAAISSSSGRATRTGSTTRVGGLGSTTCRIRPTKVVAACFPERLLRRRAVDPERVARPDLVGLAADDDAHRRLQLGFAQLHARQRPVPVVGVARGHRSHGRSSQAGEYDRRDEPLASHDLQGSR